MNDSGQMKAHEEFSPLDFPLSGRRLIEASAGTGKTYNIANLFVRLILGDGIEQPLEVDQILVVTFTRAATSELRGRIRARVEQAFQDFRQGHSEEAEIDALIPAADEERTRLIRLLNEAILRMDEACISTIHSFAVQAAKTFLFETGAIAGIEISEYGDVASRQIITDHYRFLAALQGNFSEEFKDLVLEPKKASDFQKYFQKKLPLNCRIEALDVQSLNLGELYINFQQRRSELERVHQQYAEEWQTMFPQPPEVDRKTYCVAIADRFNLELCDEFRQANKLVRGLNSLIDYLQVNLRNTNAKYADKTDVGYYKKWLLIPREAGEGHCFDFIIRLREHFSAWFELQSTTKQAGRRAILESLQEQQAEIPLDQMSLDDVIRLINQKLDDDRTAEALRQIITQSYPACLVDEFQDTDPEQFQMFNRIYEDAPENTGFFMIGDPKQSIYSFRGADIFSYLKVRSSVRGEEERVGDRKIFTLGTNWRSKRALVDATNRLFREPAQMESAPVFLFPGIEYQAVDSCEETRQQNKGIYSIAKDRGLSDKALVFVGNPDSGEGSKIDGTTLRRQYARDTAARISALLNRDSGGRITDDSSVTTPVAPGEIAVLVRSYFEARLIREELARPAIGIRSVYLSQRDSVFDEAEVSEDLFHILVAIHECTDKNRLKAALATPLLRAFAFEFDELDRLENDENDLEALIEEFSTYRLLWQQHGL